MRFVRVLQRRRRTSTSWTVSCSSRNDRSAVDARRTLDNLYLRPALGALQANDGHIYTEEAAVTLLIDIKNNGRRRSGCWIAKLADYALMLTTFTSARPLRCRHCDHLRDRANDVILSSSPAPAGIDGRLSRSGRP